jgi:hypothetical protein
LAIGAIKRHLFVLGSDQEGAFGLDPGFNPFDQRVFTFNRYLVDRIASHQDLRCRSSVSRED